MTAQEVTAIFDEFGGATIDAYGWTYGPIRVERGGGIAGHSDVFWIRFPGKPEMNEMGPYWKAKDLRKALRDFFVAVIKIGTGLLELQRLQGQ